MTRLRAVLPIFAVLLFIVPAHAQLRDFTLEQAVGRGVNLGGGGRVFLTWLPGGKQFLQPTPQGLQKIDARTGKAEPTPPMTPVTNAVAAIPGIVAADAQGFASQLYRQSLTGSRFTITALGKDFLVYDAQEKKAYRATNTPTEDKLNGQVSPDGQNVSFVKRDNNLYIADVSTAKEKQITFDGGAKILNGKLDWVYEEEVYGRGSDVGYKWSPDGKQIAFLRLDEAPVKPFAIVDQIPSDQNLESWYYPKAGDPNPIVTLGVVDIRRGTPPRFVDVANYADTDRLIVRFGWTPDSRKTLFQVQPRNQKWLDICTFDTQTGATSKLFREEGTMWVEAGAEPRFLRDGSFLWESSRTGTNHLYRYKENGTLVGAVTKGDFDIQRVNGVDEAKGVVYFTAAGNGRSWIGSDFYKVTISGGEVTRLTEKIGTHNVSLSPAYDMFTDTYTSHTTPSETILRDTNTGAVIRAIDEIKPADIPARKEYRLGTVKLVTVPMRDGMMLDGALLLPPDYDPKKKYPIFCPIYAGPAAPQLADTWGGLSGNLYNQFLAQRGIIIWTFDNRSASRRGMAATQTLYKNFGAGELRDIEDGINYLVKAGYADPKRIAISGWSFGGFMTTYALTHSTLFKVGIAGGSVMDWKLYDTIYTERYMDTPQANPDGYKASSNIAAAANISGNLLLLHGTMDDNVHVQNTMQFIYAAQNANKPFDLMLYPTSRHGVGGAQGRHLRTLQTKYLLDHL